MAATKVKPAAWLVRQQGLSQYSEILRTKREAMQAASDMLWHPGRVTVTPLYAGKPTELK